MNLPDAIFSDGLDYALGWTVLHSLWQVTLIAFFTGTALVALRRKSSQARYWAANMGLLASLLSASLTFAWYMQPVPMAPLVTEPTALAEPATPNAPDGEAKPSAKAANPAIAWAEPKEVPKPTLSTGLSLGKFKGYFNQHLPLLVLLWFAGMAIFLLKLLGGLLQTYDLRRHMNFAADPYWSEVLEGLRERFGFRQGIELLESALVRSPVTIGHLKPLILFPIGVINRLSEQEVEAILAHELAHVLRRDYLFNILQCVVEALFYYHPAIWWISSQVRNEREHACDDKAVAQLGNKINYAKALVAIQEMAFYPQTPALAFAGNRKGQLMHRVQRLFSQPKSNFNIMEKGIATALVICLVFVLALGQGFHTNDNLPLTLTEMQENAGLWEAEFDRDSVHLTLSSGQANHNWIMGDDFAIRDFENLNLADGKAQFQMNRPAGKMSFRGEIEGKTGYGRFEFTPDEAYGHSLSKQGIKGSDDHLLMLCFFANFPLNYVEKVEGMGVGQIDEERLEQLAAFRLTEPTIKYYQDLAASVGKKQVDVEDIVQLKVADATPEKIKAWSNAGYANLDFEEIAAMSIHGVDAAYIESMNKLGFGKLTQEELMAAKIQGIDAEAVKKCQGLGLGKLDFDEIMNLTIHGIDADFVEQVKKMGVEKIDAEQVVNMKIHDIDQAFVRQAKAMGFKNLTPEEIMTMKIHEIDSSYVAQVRAMGFGDLDLDEVLSMKIHEIDPAFVQQAKALGFTPLSLDQIMSMKIHGIDQAYLQQVKGMGLGTSDFDEVMSLKIHEIDPAFVQQFKGLNIGAKTTEDFLQLKIHEVSADQVKAFRDLDVQGLTVESLVGAKIHEVTPAFIQEAAKKGYRLPNLEEYIDLKVRDRVGNQKSQ